MAVRPEVYREFEKVPEHIIGEIIAGELVTTHLLPPFGVVAKSALGAMILNAVRQVWWILPAVEVALGNDILVPDLSGWLRERVTDLPEIRMIVPPDWICEVLSPATRRLDRSIKLPVYAREGVPFAWLVDPFEKTVEVFRLANGAWQLVHVYGGDEQMAAPPFEELTIDLKTVWA